MPLSQAELESYVQLLGQHARHPVVLESDMASIAVVIGALQLALRHPGFPPQSRRVIEGFLEGVLAGIGTVSPALAEGLRAGSDPANDVGGL